MSDTAGFLEFKLDYSGTKNLAIGEAVYSKNFSAGGHVWRIICYPRGFRKEENDEYLSIYLQLMSESRNVKAYLGCLRDGESRGAIIIPRSEVRAGLSTRGLPRVGISPVREAK
jgi:speckle-type POZ protein